MTGFFPYYQAHGIQAASQSLPENDHIRLDVFVLIRHQCASPAESGLDLVSYQKDLVLSTEILDPLQISGLCWQAAPVSLYALDNDRRNLLAFFLKRRFDIFQRIESDGKASDAWADVWEEGSESCSTRDDQFPTFQTVKATSSRTDLL